MNYRLVFIYISILSVTIIMIGKLQFLFETNKIDIKERNFHQRNLILSVAINLPLINIYRFIRTARSSCNYCHILIFTDNVDNSDYKELGQLYNTIFLSYKDHTPQDLKRLSVYSLRFIVYHRYLLANHYDNIFICDLKDVVFQQNIFDHMKMYNNGELYAFLESEQLSIGECRVHRAWMLTCYDETVFKNLYNQSRSCAGTILGTYKGIIKYLSLMENRIIEKPSCNDQGIHNYIMYYILNGTSTIRVTHETGFLGTLGTTEWVYRNKYGLALNKNKQVYAVIHQFHRSKQFVQQFNNEYQILPENVLNLKN